MRVHNYSTNNIDVIQRPWHEVVLTGAFLFASTTARSSPALLGWNCGYAFFSHVRKNYYVVDLQLPSLELTRASSSFQIMYDVLYSVSPEVFPAKDRGTGNGLTSSATRVFGVMVGSLQRLNFCSATKPLTHLLPRHVCPGAHNRDIREF